MTKEAYEKIAERLQEAIKVARGRPAPIENIVADEIWFEQLHADAESSSLLVAFDLRGNKFRDWGAGEPFDALIDGPGGQPIGIASFRFISCLDGRAIFQAIRLRPADASYQSSGRPISRLLMRRLVEI